MCVKGVREKCAHKPTKTQQKQSTISTIQMYVHNMCVCMCMYYVCDVCSVLVCVETYVGVSYNDQGQALFEH